MAKNLLLVGVLLLAAGALAMGGAVRSTESEEAANEPAAGYRVLRFPGTHAVGTISFRTPQPQDDEWSRGWENVRPAKGTVRVPRGKEVYLSVTADGLTVPRALSMLGPDDIQVMRVNGTPPHAVLASLARLSGLKAISFWAGMPRGTDFAFVSGLKSLESLRVRYGKVTDDDVKNLAHHLGGLKSFRRLHLSSQVTDAGLAPLSNLHSLEYVSFSSEKMTGSGFAHLAKLPALKELWVSSTSIGDTGLASLVGSTSLKRLTWHCTSTTDSGLAHLGKLKSLEGLNLMYAPITGAGLAHLHPLKSLRTLDLRFTEVTDSGLEHVAKLTSLERLELPRGITDVSLAQLRDLRSLKALQLGDIRYTGAGLQPLAGLKALEKLFCPSNITDQDLAVIGGLSSLRELVIKNSPVTNEGLRHLSSLKSLHRLAVFRCKAITTSGLAHLRGLPIKSLHLYALGVDDSRLAFLEGLPELELLSILNYDFPRRGDPLRDDDLASVGKLAHLKDLTIINDAVGDGGMAHLAGLTSLERLDASFPVTDEGLKHLASMKKLRDVNVHGDITDRGLRHLEGVKSLGSLRLSTGNELSPAAVERLKKALPRLHNVTITRTRVSKSPPKIGQVAPAFAVKTLDGRPLRLQDYRGKVVLLYYWSTDCKPCIASAPALKDLHKELSRYKGFAMISLSLDDADFVVRQHVQHFGLAWPQVRLGFSSEMAAEYGVRGLPAYFVIGPDGKVLYSGLDWDQIRKTVAIATDR